MAQARRRRTQSERTASTRARLLEATFDCLVELGYAQTTTAAIADRAGLSRGAQLHHFRTREGLLSAAIEHVFAKRLDEFRVAARALPGERRVPAAIDLLWSMFTSPTFYGWLELLVAARTDAGLHERVSAISAEFDKNVERLLHELVPTPGGEDVLPGVLGPAIWALFAGMATTRLAVGETKNHQRILESLKALVSSVIPASASA